MAELNNDLDEMFQSFESARNIRNHTPEEKAVYKNEESKIQKRLIKWLNKQPNIYVFRVNAGQVKTIDGHWYHGAPKGTSDIIGYQTITITPDMVGQDIARFLAVEVKHGDNKASISQKAFLRKLKKFGGVSIIANGIDMLKRKLKKYDY